MDQTNPNISNETPLLKDPSRRMERRRNGSWVLHIGSEQGRIFVDVMARAVLPRGIPNEVRA